MFMYVKVRDSVTARKVLSVDKWVCKGDCGKCRDSEFTEWNGIFNQTDGAAGPHPNRKTAQIAGGVLPDFSVNGKAISAEQTVIRVLRNCKGIWQLRVS